MNAVTHTTESIAANESSQGVTMYRYAEVFGEKIQNLLNLRPAMLRQVFRDDSGVLGIQLRSAMTAFGTTHQLPQFIRRAVLFTPNVSVRNADECTDQSRPQPHAAMSD